MSKNKKGEFITKAIFKLTGIADDIEISIFEKDIYMTKNIFVKLSNSDQKTVIQGAVLDYVKSLTPKLKSF